MSTSSLNVNNNCSEEPWGRYSASGGLFSVPNTTSQYIYSFGGDTTSDGDGQGGVVRTNFRFDLATKCWERISDSPEAIGYRATATQLSADPDSIWILFGADASRVATNQVYKYSLSNGSFEKVEPSVQDDAGSLPAPRWKHAAVALDATKILVTGGRSFGQTVLNDAWVFDTATESFTALDISGEFPPLYRHGMAFDSGRNLAWLYGGLDNSLSRHDSDILWQLNLTSLELQALQTNTTYNEPPPRLASFAMDFLPHADLVMAWGGTCSDESELHLWDPTTHSWCRIFPSMRPDRRDAMLFGIDWPLLYVSQGDSICYNRQVLPVADVFALNLSDPSAWQQFYTPYNSRGTGQEPLCDGTNAGNCQPQFLLADTSTQLSTCSAHALERLQIGVGSNTDEMTATTNSSIFLGNGTLEFESDDDGMDVDDIDGSISRTGPAPTLVSTSSAEGIYYYNDPASAPMVPSSAATTEAISAARNVSVLHVALLMFLLQKVW